MTLRRNRLARVAACILLPALVISGTQVAQANADSSIARSVSAAVKAPALGTTMGTYVHNIATGDKVLGRGGIRPLIPASTMKVITAYAAVRSLGANYRFTTKVVKGRTAGSIVLVGGGDPILTRGDLAILAKRTAKGLKRAGISQTVRVDFDERMFPKPTNAPGWESGDMPSFISAVRPLTLLGLYSTDTSRATTQAFVTALQGRGVSATLGTSAPAKRGAERLGRFRSNDLGEAVGVLLPVSENNVAEIIFRHIAKKAKLPLDWAGASRAVREVLAADGIRVKGIRVVDGSGLSYDNRLTARTLTDTLTQIATRPDMSRVRDALPIAGETGTLRNRFGQEPARCAQGKVAAKTGSLPPSVSTLAGLTRSTDGQQRAFAILVNQRPSNHAWTATSAAIDAVAAAVQGCNR